MPCLPSSDLPGISYGGLFPARTLNNGVLCRRGAVLHVRKGLTICNTLPPSRLAQIGAKVGFDHLQKMSKLCAKLIEFAACTFSMTFAVIGIACCENPLE